MTNIFPDLELKPYFDQYLNPRARIRYNFGYVIKVGQPPYRDQRTWQVVLIEVQIHKVPTHEIDYWDTVRLEWLMADDEYLAFSIDDAAELRGHGRSS